MLLKVSTINSGIVYIHSWKVYAYLTKRSEIKHSQLCHRPVPKHSQIGQGTSFHPFATSAACLLASASEQPSLLVGDDSPNSVAMTPPLI